MSETRGTPRISENTFTIASILSNVGPEKLVWLLRTRQKKQWHSGDFELPTVRPIKDRLYDGLPWTSEFGPRRLKEVLFPWCCRSTPGARDVGASIES